MILLKQLIRNKQNTVMTNTQIIEILKQEFDIDIKSCHEIQVDIYIKIIKKYLKDWPQWEELERISTKLCTARDFDAVSKVLANKYKNLKEYLGVMLDAAKPLAKQAVTVITSDSNKEDTLATSEVVMEVYCTRDQLNHLFYRKPRTDLHNAIFNINKIEPTRISLNTLSFESILNFCWTKIYINLPQFIYFRELVYKYKHKLINKAREDKSEIEVLDTRVHNRAKKTKDFSKKAICEYFDKILELCKDEHVIQILEVIFNVLKTDLEAVPDVVKVPSSYRRFGNQYKYVRYLYVENKRNTDPKYDLQLEETVSPTFQLFIGKLGAHPEAPIAPFYEWLKIECMMCKFKFPGSTELMTLLQAHFNDYHQQDPDWQCPHCRRLFSMDYLSKNRWSHDC